MKNLEQKGRFILVTGKTEEEIRKEFLCGDNGMGEKMACAQKKKKTEEDQNSSFLLLVFEDWAPELCSEKAVRERGRKTTYDEHFSKILCKLVLSYVCEVYKNSVCSYPFRYWG